MSLKSYLKYFSYLVQKNIVDLSSLSHLVSSRLTSSLALFPLLSLSGQSSLRLLYFLSHFVKDLPGQPSDWPVG